MMVVEVEVIRSLRRIMRAAELWSKRLHREHGLTAPQLAAIRCVADQPGIRPKDVAKTLHLSPATLVPMLTKLEARGLIQKTTSNSDRRSLCLTATAEGTKAASGAPPLLRDAVGEGLRNLPDWEQHQLLSSLQKLAEIMCTPDRPEGSRPTLTDG